jgi:integrase
VTDVPDGRPASVDDQLGELTRQMLVDSVPVNTRRAYASQWAQFTAWCGQVGRRALPATTPTLTEYVAHLIGQKRGPASIEQAMAAVRSAHRAAGHDVLPGSRDARVLLRAYRRTRARGGQRVRQAAPITGEELRLLVGATDPQRLVGLRDRVLLTLGFAMMARRSELIGLDLDDIREVDEGLVVLVRASKDDQDARGRDIAVLAAADPALCPVRATRAWRSALADRGITKGALLRAVDRHGNLAAGPACPAMGCGGSCGALRPGPGLRTARCSPPTRCAPAEPPPRREPAPR